MINYENTPITLIDFFSREFGENTVFTDAFLNGKNLIVIQRMLTQNLRRATRNPSLPLVQFTENLLSALLQFAFKYRLAWGNENTLQYANYTFVEQLSEQNESHFYENAFWKRWCEQGIPDPNNIPLPTPGDRTDFTTQTDGYMLSNPIGGMIEYRYFPRR